MDMIEPGRVIGLLEDVKYRHYDSRQALVEVVDALDTVQQLLEDAVSDAMRRASDAAADLHDAGQRVRRWHEDLDTVHAAAQAACNDAWAQEAHARNVRADADNVLNHWRMELDLAVSARIAAQAAVNAASGRKMQADNELSAAYARLAGANAALSACENDISYDSEGRIIYPNCSGYASSVSAAQDAQGYAQAEANNAAWALNGAHQQLGVAQGREQLCTSRRDQAQNAVATANSACTAADRAVAVAQGAISSANNIYPLVREMERLLVVTRDRVQACTNQAHVARNHVDDGMQQFHTSRADAATNGQDAARMDERLLEKVDLMQKFDTPTL